MCASKNITTFSPSSKLSMACEQTLVTSPSIREALCPRIRFRPWVTRSEERFARLMAWKVKRKLAKGSRQEEFEEFLLEQVSKTPSSYKEVYGLNISVRNANYPNWWYSVFLFLRKFICSAGMAMLCIIRWRLSCPKLTARRLIFTELQ